MSNNNIIILIFFFLISTSYGMNPKESTTLRKLEDNEDTSIPSYNKDEYDSVTKQLDEKISNKPTLLGFGKFQRSENKFNGMSIFFKNIAKRVQINPFKKYIYFKVIFRKKNNNRYLEENEEENKVVSGFLDEKTLSEKFVEYSVKNILDNEDDYFDIKPNFRFLNENVTDEKTLELVEKELDGKYNAISYSRNFNFKNISEQKELDTSSILYFNAFNIINIYTLIYKIKGNFSREIESISENMTFEYYEQGETLRTLESKIEEVKNENNNYSLYLKFNDFVNADLNNYCKATIPRSNITLKRSLEEENPIELYLWSYDEDLLKFDENPQPNHFGRKIASSSGLSGGAIAGIVIACAVALIGVAITFIYFNKPTIKPKDARAIEFYNNSNANANSSTEVIQK